MPCARGGLAPCKVAERKRPIGHTIARLQSIRGYIYIYISKSNSKSKDIYRTCTLVFWRWSSLIWFAQVLLIFLKPPCIIDREPSVSWCFHVLSGPNTRWATFWDPWEPKDLFTNLSWLKGRLATVWPKWSSATVWKSRAYDPKTSVAKFLLPRSPHFFRYSFHPPKTCDHTVLPKLHRRFGHLTLTRRGHHGKDLGLLVASIGGTAKNQPEMIPWSGWHFFDQKGVGGIQSPVIWKLYNFLFCFLDGGLLSWLQVIFVKVLFCGWVYSRNLPILAGSLTWESTYRIVNCQPGKRIDHLLPVLFCVARNGSTLCVCGRWVNQGPGWTRIVGMAWQRHLFIRPYFSLSN